MHERTLAATGKQNGNSGQRRTIMNRERILEVALTMLGAVLPIITAPGAWAQQSTPPASDQKMNRSREATAQPLKLQCSGPPASDQKSIAVFEQQAAKGDAAAQCGLGKMYALGQGVPRDNAQAALWYRKAAEQGYAKAQDYLGYLYYDGQGVPQDNTQAAVWYRKAAERGDANAQFMLGELYADGQGVPHDYAQAAFWFRKAAEQGDAGAQDALGEAYNDGLGVPQDYAEAYFWIDLGVAGELDASIRKNDAAYRDMVASHLTPADLSREQERARKWFEEHQTKPQ
ncbi:MAG TPA: tetratricopeptide repeat protein [Acidobacteriaceae bacterium]